MQSRAEEIIKNGSGPPVKSWRVSGVVEGNCTSPLGIKTLAGTTWGSLPYHMNTSASEHYFVILPVTYLPWDLGYTHQPIGTSNGIPQAKQVGGQGLSTTYQWAGCIRTP